MKKRILLLAILGASIISCDKLDEVVYSSLTDANAFTTGENAQAAVNSIYAPLRSLYREPMFYINDIAADTGFKDGNCFEVMNDDANYVDNRTETAWTLLTQIAARANIVIDKVPQMSDGLFRNGITKEQLLGEAYFMRAFAYMNLTDVFYRVPLITDSDIDPTAKEPLASVKDIEKQIENDLFNAKDYLPKSYASRDDAGRPTYGAACGYLARLYMRQAGRARLQGDADAADYWNYALEEVNNVLALEGVQYSLQPSVWDVFDPTSEDKIYNNELIFAIRASGSIVSGSWDLGLQFTSWDYDMGWGNMYQPLEMTWKFDHADQRYSVLQVVSYENVYNPDVLSCLANLSNDEVFTPPDVVNKMLDMLPQELFRNPDTTFLDPACKTGVFLREIAKRLIVGLEPQMPDLQQRVDHIFRKQLYGIAITELTSLLSRRGVYCSKYPNSEFSVSRFDDAQGNIRCHFL